MVTVHQHEYLRRIGSRRRPAACLAWFFLSQVGRAVNFYIEGTMTDTTMNWRDAYARRAAELVSSNPDISIPELAQRLAMPVDDLDRILGHPLAPILERWRATKPGYGWAALERTNA